MALPNREPLQTHRTTAAVVPATYDDMLGEQLMSVTTNSTGYTRGSTPGISAIEPMHSTRKSAIKARMNIAAEAAGLRSTPNAEEEKLERAMYSVIKFSSGNRFSTMVDHMTKPMSSM